MVGAGWRCKVLTHHTHAPSDVPALLAWVQTPYPSALPRVGLHSLSP